MQLSAIQTIAMFAGLLCVCCVALFLLRHKDRQSQWIFPALLALLHLLFFLLNWNRIGIPFSDLGGILYAPWRVLCGELLYDDMFWHYGPLEPLYHALLYKFFGVHSSVLQVQAIVTHLAVLLLLYHCIARTTDGKYAFVFTLLAFGVSLTDTHLTFPYSFSALYGLLAVLCAFAWLPRVLEYHRTKDFLVLGAILGVGGLTKQNYGFFAFCGFALFFLYYFLSTTSEGGLAPRAKLARLLLLIMSCGLVTWLPYAYFITASANPVLTENIAPVFHGMYFSRTYLTCLRESMDCIGASWSVLSVSHLFIHAIVFAAFGLGILREIRLYGAKRTTMDWMRTACLFAAAFLMLTFNFMITHAHLVVPVLCVLLANSLYVLAPVRNAVRLNTALLCMVTGIGMAVLAGNFRWENSKSFLLESPHLRLYEAPHLGRPIQEASDYILSKAKPDDRLVVISHQNIFHMTTGLHTPLRYFFIHLPGYLDEQREQQVADQLRERPVRFIVRPIVLQQGYAMFGKKGQQLLWLDKGIPLEQELVFGRDFYPAIGKALDEVYHVTYQNDFYLVLEPRDIE